MNPQYKNALIGLVLGYAAGAIGGHFFMPGRMHHIGAICGVIGAVVGYNQSTSTTAATPAMPAAAPVVVAPVTTS